MLSEKRAPRRRCFTAFFAKKMREFTIVEALRNYTLRSWWKYAKSAQKLYNL
jgi:hypothetical protein